MTVRGRAFIAGAYEHPRREIPDRSVAQVHGEVAAGALADAGLSLSDVDAYFCDSTAGFGPISMVEYLGLRPRYIESTDTGGSSYLVHVGHAASAIAAGRCHVALVTMAGLPRSRSEAPVARSSGSPSPASRDRGRKDIPQRWENPVMAASSEISPEAMRCKVRRKSSR